MRELEKELRTVGSQLVGRIPLHCESKGASDYCRHCGKLIVTNGPCKVLEELRLKRIPEEEIAAFGCWTESLDPMEGVRCEKWCRSEHCPVSLHDAEAALPSAHPKDETP